jgi:pilus assembly protein Flp/PilA
MNKILFNLYAKFQDLENNEEGQNLVEYALIVALVAIATVAGLSTLATNINSVFAAISGMMN